MLFCVPCADMYECTITAERKTTFSASNHKDKHQTENEACTPFCACACCAVSIFFQPVTSYKIPNDIFQKINFPVQQISYTAQVFLPIWQPPKLS